jgi:hypothetical protein
MAGQRLFFAHLKCSIERYDMYAYKQLPARIRYDIGHVAVNRFRFGLPFGAEKRGLEPVNGIKRIYDAPFEVPEVQCVS